MSPTLQEVGVHAIVKGYNAFMRQSGDVSRQITSMGNAGRTASTGTSLLGTAMKGLGSFLGGVLTVATGIITARVFTKIADQLKTLISDAWDAAAAFQGLTVQFETLMAREIRSMNQPDNLGAFLLDSGMSQSQVDELGQLRSAYDSLIGQIQTAEASGRTTGETWDLMNSQAESLKSQIEGLTDAYSGQAPWMQAVATGSMDMETALQMAEGPARDILDWAKLMGVSTPFSAQMIAETTAFGMAMNFTSDEAKELTTNVLDFVSGMGLPEPVMKRIIENFGQMRNAGKVTGTELRDLARGSFLPITDVLKRMQSNLGLTGMSFDDFRQKAAEGAYDVDAFFLAFNQIIEEDFAGASERLAQTWTGATQNLKNFVDTFLGVEIFGPILDILGEKLAGFLDTMANEETLASFREMGEAIGELFEALVSIPEMFGIQIKNPFTPDTIDTWTATIEGWKTTLQTKLAEIMTGLTEGTLFEDTVFSIMDFLNIGDEDTKAELSGQFEMIGNQLSVLAEEWGPILGDVFSGIGETFSSVFNEASGEILTNMVEGLINFLGYLVDHREQIGEAMTNIGEHIEGIITSAGNLAMAFSDFALDFEELWLDLADGFMAFSEGDFAEGIQLMVDGLSDFVTDAIPQFWEDFWASFSDHWETIKDDLNKWGDDWFDLGEDWVDGLLEGLKANVHKITSWFTNLWNSIKDLADEAFSRHSPSLWFKNFATDLMRGLTIGIDDEATRVVGSLNDTYSKMQSASTQKLSGMVSSTSNVSYQNTYSFEVNANYERSQSPIAIRHDLQAILGMVG